MLSGGEDSTPIEDAQSLEEAKQQLEVLQVQSIVGMIEDVKLKDQTVKLLYLTNR